MKEQVKQIFHSNILKKDNRINQDDIINERVNLKKINVCIVDNGLFSDLGYTLSKYFGKVYYYTPFYDAFPDISKVYPGYGIEGVNKITELYDHYSYNDNYYDFDDIDLFIFPDVGFGGLQEHLIELGKKVWGSRRCEDIEIYRLDGKRHFKSLGMDVNPMKTIKGLTNLLKYFEKNTEECFYKISLIRGLFETRKHISYEETKYFLLNKISMLGIIEKDIEIIIEEPIKSFCESGKDIYTVDGEFPKNWIVGYEDKGAGYICGVVNSEKLSKRVTDVTYKLKDTFKNYGYRGWFSDEIKNSKDGKNYLLDFAARLGNPPAAITQVINENLGEVIYYGANGILKEPIYIKKYAAQLTMDCPEASERNIIVKFPQNIRDYVKLNFACRIEGEYSSVNQPIAKIDTLGYVVGIGDTIEDAIEHCKENASKIQADSLKFDYNVFDSLKKYIKEGEKIGIYL